MAAVTICSDFGAPKNKVWHCFHCFPIYLPWSDGIRCHDLSFWMLSFKPTFSLSSFTFIKRLFSSFSLSAIRVVSSAYLRLLIFLLAILIPACASSKANRILPREITDHSKYPLPTTQETILHMDITRWSILKSDWLYSLKLKMEKLYTVSKNKTGSCLWLRSWTPYCQIQT